VARDLRAEQEVEWEGAGIPAEVAAAPTVAKPSEKVVITGERLRAWGWLSALSLVDQGLASGAGFAVNLLLARWMEPEVYGAFAVAFAGFLFVSGFHNVLLLEPISVMGPSRHAERLPGYFRAQIEVHFVLVGALCGVSLFGGLILWEVIPGSPLLGAVMGGGLALPFLLLAWVARRICYVMRRPSAAALGSGLYLSLVVAGLFVLAHYGWLGSFTAFLLMGCGSILASGLQLWRLGLLKRGPVIGTDVSWRAALQENWTYGRWLVGSALLYPAVSQAQVVLTATLLGLGAAGILRAMQLPSLAMTQVITAAGLLFLPALSGDFASGTFERMRHKAMLVSLGLAAVALCFAGFLAVFSVQVEQLLFEGKYFAQAWLMSVLALTPVASALSTGYSMALRASQRPQFDLLANLVAAPVGLLSAFLFIRWWGLGGAAGSLVLGFFVLCGVTLACFRSQRPGRV
jgi:O-antigen/teichoic acid export membrane protein